MYTEPRVLPCGDSALNVEFSNEISEAVNILVLAFERNLSRQTVEGIIETVPTYRSLLIHYDPLVTTFESLKRELTPHLPKQGLSQSDTNRKWFVPVVYGGNYGIDLEILAMEKKLSPGEVVERHCSVDYRVNMIGFMPGFAYLGGLDPILATPRRKNPRPNAPKGTISIGGEQTALQSVVGPSGWHWIGRTPLEVYAPNRNPMCLLDPGDIVRFYAIEKESWPTESERCEEMIREATQ